MRSRDNIVESRIVKNKASPTTEIFHPEENVSKFKSSLQEPSIMDFAYPFIIPYQLMRQSI